MYHISIHLIQTVLSVYDGLLEAGNKVKACVIVMLNGFQYLGKDPHRAAGEQVSECGDEACGTFNWQGENCHHGQFLHCYWPAPWTKWDGSSLPLRKIRHLHSRCTPQWCWRMIRRQGHNKRENRRLLCTTTNQNYFKVRQASAG